MQSTNKIFLVRPANFGFNAETAISNAFQNKINESKEIIQEKVIAEFNQFAKTLLNEGIDVTIFDDTKTPIKPDAIFPNNWISMHANGTLVLYPMQAENRRLERRADIVEEIKNKFQVKRIFDLTDFESQNKFLEGTGSIVFDHYNKIAFACLSPRTDKTVLKKLCSEIGYKPFCFAATDAMGKEIYHTNVMMCVADEFVVICLESIANANERKKIIQQFETTHHTIIDISFEQMKNFAGNMLALKNKEGKTILVLSQSSYNSLYQNQKTSLEKFCKLVPQNIPTIETIGGGSARCMIAEIFF